LMGDYKLDKTKTAMLSNVYKKTDSDYYIFYTKNGYWDVGKDINFNGGWLRSVKRGLLFPPRTGWRYAIGTCGDKCWFSDDTLQLIYLK